MPVAYLTEQGSDDGADRDQWVADALRKRRRVIIPKRIGADVGKLRKQIEVMGINFRDDGGAFIWELAC